MEAVNGQRGFSLLEATVAIGLVALVAMLGTGAFLAKRPYAAHDAALRFTALVDEARSLAATSGNGATLVITDAGNGGTTVTLRAGRPNAAGFGSATDVAVLSAVVALDPVATAPPFAIFIDAAGTDTASGWTASDGTLTNEPACPGAMTLSFSAGGATETRALRCDAARL